MPRRTTTRSSKKASKASKPVAPVAPVVDIANFWSKKRWKNPAPQNGKEIVIRLDGDRTVKATITSFFQRSAFVSYVCPETSKLSGKEVDLDDQGEVYCPKHFHLDELAMKLLGDIPITSSLLDCEGDTVSPSTEGLVPMWVKNYTTGLFYKVLRDVVHDEARTYYEKSELFKRGRYVVICEDARDESSEGYHPHGKTYKLNSDFDLETFLMCKGWFDAKELDRLKDEKMIKVTDCNGRWIEIHRNENS